MFPFTVGANIGTTVTGIMSALASSNIKVGMQVALAHLFFNLAGTLIWFPLPFMRAVPLGMAKVLGGLASDLPWFPIAYIFVMFAVLPLVFFLLSLAGVAAIATLGSLLFLGMVGIVVVLCLRRTRPHLLPEFFRGDPAWMPETLRVQRSAEVTGGTDAQAGGEAADADLDAKGRWPLAQAAWGLAWILLLMLIVAVPNAQWANMKYVAFDPREHVGIGAWSACSKQYTKAVAWAEAPSCTQAEAATCWSWIMGSCSADGFSEAGGANKIYEKSWENCTSHFQCSPSQWEAACLIASCGGSQHAYQCQNLTRAVSRALSVSYGTAGAGTAWEAGEACRSLDQVCDNAGPIGHAGNLAVVALLFVCLGQALLLVYQFLRKLRDVRMALVAAAVSFSFAWVMLLASWATFSGAVSGEATCVIVDVTTRKAVRATGPFGEIVNGGGSYSLGFIIFAWLLLTAVLPVIVHRIMHDRHADDVSQLESSVKVVP